MKKAFKIISVILVVCIVVSGVVVGVLKKDEINYFYSAMHNASVALSEAGKTQAKPIIQAVLMLTALLLRANTAASNLKLQRML